MGLDRIKWYNDRGYQKFTEPFKAIRADRLPDWPREACEPVAMPRAKKASMFAETGRPFRAEFILE